MTRASLLLTRPDGANAPFFEGLPEACRARLRPIESPLLALSPVSHDDPGEADFAAIFSSAQGVRFGPEGQGRAAFCVGARTAEAARAAGWRASCEGADADALVAALSAGAPGAAPLVHFAGRHQRGDIVERLRAAGHAARRVVVYDQQLRDLTAEALAALAAPGPLLAPLFSPRTAAQFARQLTPAMTPDLLALSPAVAEALPRPWRARCRIAPRPEAAAMAAMVRKWSERAAWVEGTGTPE